MQTRDALEACRDLRDVLTQHLSKIGASSRTGVALWYAPRPNRTLPLSHRVFTFWSARLTVLGMGSSYVNVDNLIKRIFLPPVYRWRSGGVQEWDGLVVDVHHKSIVDMIEQDLSMLVFHQPHQISLVYL